MNRLIFILTMCIASNSYCQTKYFTKTGTIIFFAGTAVEDVDAVNKSVTSVFDSSTGRLEFAVLIKGFEFKRGLMQEHFNENYMESEKYPKAIFKGKFNDLSRIDFTKDETYPVTVSGSLEMHNVAKDISVPGTIKIMNGIISSEAVFKVALKDYKIEIPGAVKDKISPDVEIQVNCTYKKL